MAVLEAGRGGKEVPGTLPKLGFAEFLRAQRLPGPPPPQPAADSSGDDRLYRLRMRLWAVNATAAVAEGDGGTTKAEPPEEDEPALRAAVSAALRREAGEVQGGRRNDSGSDSDGRPRGAGGAAKRGRGFEGREEAAPVSKQTRHCYRRFGPRVAGRVYLRDSFAKAPWPSARLRRLPAAPVIWRPEWRVGPDGGDAAEKGALGGMLSWAVEPSSTAQGEGFEVSLRSGPGPEVDEVKMRSASTESADADDDNPDRDEDDFVLSFRRGERAWHFVAGRRGRKTGGAQKVIADPPGGGKTRQMFWVACTECRADGKHYVVVGTVPGHLTEHFFVAKVGRAEPLSHAGFSYLPHPGEVAFGRDRSQEPPALIMESITVYPHGLTGDLPFISLRFVEQRAAADAADGGEDVLARAKMPADGEAALELAVRRAALPSAEAGPERFAGWCRAARRECGLPLPRDEEEERARRAEKRARLRVEPRPIMKNPSEAPSSWEPCAGDMPALGPNDETLRHAPAAWAALRAKAEEEAEERAEQVPTKEAPKEEMD